jgi:hypothetical protein
MLAALYDYLDLTTTLRITRDVIYSIPTCATYGNAKASMHLEGEAL